MKIAIIGGTGLLGSNLTQLYSSFADVRSYSRKESFNISKFLNFIIDFKNLELELENEFENWTPDIIINAVAIVDLNFCENNLEFSYDINTKLAEKLAGISKKYNSYFIHISTDHFFNDNLITHSELDEVKLLNNYAKTKYEAEKKVLKENKSSLVVRTNIVGFRNNEKDSFFEWLINNLKKNNKINCYSNYFTSPIEVTLLGEILLECYNKKLYGIFNISSSEVISKYDFALKTAEKFSLERNLINKIKLENNGNVKRALSLGLNVNKIEMELGIKMPNIDCVLNVLLKKYMEKNKYEYK